jgi:uncharacterized protein (TIGR03437 family)
MCRSATVRVILRVVVPALAATHAWGQSRVETPALEWRHIGNSAVELGLASVATGPVARVWYSNSGDRLLAATSTGRSFTTTDFEQWRAAAETPAVAFAAAAAHLPEPGAQVREAAGHPGRLYGFRHNVWRSDDGGLHWTNLTEARSGSVIGADIADLAVSPVDADEIAVAAGTGVWRSVDAGASWSGLNQFLPNLPGYRILSTPAGVRGVRIALTASGRDLEWAPGAKTAWMPLATSSLAMEAQSRRAIARTLRTQFSAFASSGDYSYAGGSDGRLWASSDGGRSWRAMANLDEAGPVTAIFVDAKDPRIAVAVSGTRPAGAERAVHVRKTMNGGAFWDDVTGNLPDAAANGVAVDHGSGTIYAGTEAGLFMTTTDLVAAGPAGNWTRISEGLPAAPVADVRLDAAGNQLFAAVDGYGVYATLAPHRLRDPQVVSAADYIARAAAPGSLLTVLGARITQAALSSVPTPVLAANALESQIQVPFDARGDTLALTLRGAGGEVDRTVALRAAAPAVFVDSEGAPMILDADSGLMLDAMHPAHAHGRMQILATGLGRVTPDWPAGVAAPSDNPPRVNAPVRVLIDRQPVTVTRAVLAPGYVGFYLVEVEVPAIVNAGPAELYVETGNQSSNRVRVWLEP